MMAEFQEVLKQWRRMCRDGSNYVCCDCKMYSSIDESVCRGIPDDNDAKIIEGFVMAWAAENPEPVYPTWADYISRLIIHDMCEKTISGPETVLTYAMNTNIPAEIAQKLGIEPKEG